MSKVSELSLFFGLLRNGLWKETNLIPQIEKEVWDSIYSISESQGVLGLITDGIEKSNLNLPLNKKLLFVGAALQIEHRNRAMNVFIADIVERMRAQGINTLLVKGQGVAQCYEKPLWRPSGDVDFLLSEDNYKKAKEFLLPLSSVNKPDEKYSKHLGMNIDQWYVEIHGTLRTGLSTRLDREVDDNQDGVFLGGNVRSWDNHGVQVFLPAPNEDVFFVFTHFIKHFYKEGMSLRQVCDWCRLLWTYRSEVDLRLLEKRLRGAGLIREWKAFATLAVKHLGMPAEAMPFYDDRCKKDDRRGNQLMDFILKGYSGSKVKDTCQIAKIFPWKVIRYSPSIFLNVNWLKIKERLCF